MNKLEISKKQGLTGIGTCVLCCALPFIGMAIGVTAFTAIAFYLKKIGIVLIGAAVIFFLYTRFKKSQAAPSCSTECASKPAPVIKN